MNTPNPELQLAEDFVQQTNCHIFLTGKAGTGKTTFLQDLQKKTAKRMVVTAPTGVAAINAGGVTLHSFFQMPFGPFVPGSEQQQEQHRFSREKINIIKGLDLLVIDEISMVRADLLDRVDSVLRRYRHGDQPFGGVQLLMIGDLHQLSPVVKEAEWQLLRQYYKSAYFYDSLALRATELLAIELKHIYRQTDLSFIELLNRVRDNRLDAASKQLLSSRVMPDFTPTEKDGYITLCTHNSSADSINQARLTQLKNTTRSFQAEIDGDFPEQAYPTPARLELKVGAQVMFVRNDPSPEKRYFNGKIGCITGIFDDSVSIQCPGDREEIEVTEAIWENVDYRIDPETLEISQHTIGSFRQMPLKLAWAITIHKSQGLTFDRAIIDARAAFAPGQVYVALSRCRTFEGLVLSSPLPDRAVQADAGMLHYVEQAGRNPPSRAKLAQARIAYQQQLLNECFDFQQLRSRLGRFLSLLTRNAGLLQVTGVPESGSLEKQCREEIFQVGENFKRQLQGLFLAKSLPEEDIAIRERIGKASGYFDDRLNTLLLPFIANIQVDTDNKEIRKKIRDALKALTQEAAVKLAAVRACRDGFSPAGYLRAVAAAAIDLKPVREKKQSVAIDDSAVGHPILFQNLKDWRASKARTAGVPHYQILHQKTLVQIAVLLPDSLAALKKIKGIGPRLAEKYGSELVELVVEYRREQGIVEAALPEPARNTTGESAARADKIDTKQLSYELFRQGLSIAGIAGQRGLAVSTIESHLRHFVESGHLALDRLLEPEKRRSIEEKINEPGGKTLSEIKLALGEDISYGEIRFVLAHRKYLENNEKD